MHSLAGRLKNRLAQAHVKNKLFDRTDLSGYLNKSITSVAENKVSWCSLWQYLLIVLITWMVIFFLFQGSVLALDDSIVDGDRVDYLIKFCPTKEEMELLKVHFSSCSIPLWNIISFLVNCILVYQQYLFPSASYIDMVIFNFFRVIQAKRRT